jgi:hypothetical protein
MSFNKYFIPEPEVVAGQVKDKGPKAFISRKIDAVIGNPVSVNILDHIYEEVTLGKDDATVMQSLSKKFPIYFNGESVKS